MCHVGLTEALVTWNYGNEVYQNDVLAAREIHEATCLSMIILEYTLSC
jgi:hypothetical protein